MRAMRNYIISKKFVACQLGARGNALKEVPGQQTLQCVSAAMLLAAKLLAAKLLGAS